MAARIAAAAPMNYAVTALATASLARALPGPALEASTAATLAAFPLFAIVAMAAFTVRSVLKLWVTMLGAAVVLGLGLWMSFLSEGRV